MKKLLSVAFLALIMVCGCQEDYIPDGIIPPGHMSQILEDLHVAESYVNTNFQYSDSSKFVYKKLEDSIMQVHKTQLSIFDSSMLFYQKHVKLLDKIYAATVDSLNMKKGVSK